MDEEEKKPNLMVIGLALIAIIGVVFAGVFILGSAVTCYNSDGYYSISGFRCRDVEVVMACKDLEGNIRQIPDEYLYLVNITQKND